MRRGGVLVVVVVLTTGLVVPASSADPDLEASELEVVEGRLAGAERELAEIEASVRRTSDEIAALDQRLRTATTELSQVRDQLARAEAALATARVEERRTAGALSEADRELDGLLSEWDSQRTRLEERAVQAYKHGRGARSDLFIRGVISAADWHEVTVTFETVGRIIEDDRTLVDTTAELTRDTASVRGAVGQARQTALAAAREAATEQRRVERLVSRQERLVAQVEEELARKAVVLRELEADAEARAALVLQLRRRVFELEVAALGALVPVNLGLDVHGAAPVWAEGLPAAGQPYGPAIEAIAGRHGIDGRLLAAVVWAESGFRADAVSHAGALGLTQLMPATARGLGVDPRDPLQNLDGGARYLRSQLQRFGSVDLALAAYNAGPGRVETAGGMPDLVETQLYVLNVLERYARLAGV